MKFEHAKRDSNEIIIITMMQTAVVAAEVHHQLSSHVNKLNENWHTLQAQTLNATLTKCCVENVKNDGVILFLEMKTLDEIRPSWAIV